jgi:hypothetical protein
VKEEGRVRTTIGTSTAREQQNLVPGCAARVEVQAGVGLIPLVSRRKRNSEGATKHTKLLTMSACPATLLCAPFVMTSHVWFFEPLQSTA